MQTLTTQMKDAQATTKKNIVVLVSGSGSNLQAIIDACESGCINGQVIAVISNVADVYALQRAAAHNIKAITLVHKDYADRVSFDSELAKKISDLQADVIVLAGFMRILSAPFVEQFAGKLFNIHPSLLPKYPGLHTHKKALTNNDEYHGCSIHFVTAELDGGPLVIQSRIAINASDTEQTLITRIAEKEWLIYPLILSWFCQERLRLVDDQVWLDNNKIKNEGLLYEDILQLEDDTL
jgi:phosphoribosylglycinamide formyltransferase-1